MLDLIARGLTCTVSCLIALTVVEVVPPPIGLGLIGFGLVVLLVAASAAGEWTVVSVLALAKRLSATQRTVLSEVLVQLEGLELHPRHILVSTRNRPGQESVWWYGRATAVLTPEFISSVRSGSTERNQAVAALAHARAEERAWHRRSGMVVLVITLPYRAILAGGQIVFSRGLPRLGWKLRWVVGGVAVYESYTQGRALAGAGVAVLLALTYLLPALARMQWRRAESAADQALIDLGLGQHYAQWITQGGGFLDPVRRDRLCSNVPPPPPRLRLVPTGP